MFEPVPSRLRSLCQAGTICIGLVSAAGCSRAPELPAAPAATAQGGMFEHNSPGSPLTREEVSAFLAVLRRLPGARAPEFAESSLPRLTSTEGLDAAVLRLRKAIRDAVTPERQAQAWLEQPDLQQAFAQLHVNPQAFAGLMLRISCAWSAWTISRETSLEQAGEQLNYRTAQLLSRLRDSSQPLGLRERHDLLETLEEMVSVTEFLQLLRQVPAESLQTVAVVQSELQTVLPESTLAREFARHVESQSAILRAGYQTR